MSNQANQKTAKLYIISGERSGDLHTSNFLKSLNKSEIDVNVRAWAGDLSKAQGADIVVDYRDIAIMGFWEVVKNLGKVYQRIQFCKKDILAFKPDLVLLVDYGGFNMRMAKFCKENNIPVYYYISPKIWAWNTKRALKIKKYVDKMFVILPFEKDFFKKFDYSVTYVGNPLLDAMRLFKPNEDFRKDNDLGGKPIVAVLPGSRKQEVNNMLGMMIEMADRFPNYKFVVGGVNNLPESIYNDALEHPNISIVYEQTYDILKNATAAVVTSGTATLETALFHVPQVICYKTSQVTYQIIKKFIKVQFIGLANLICNKEIVKELIQRDLTIDNLAKELQLILPGEKNRPSVLSGYDELKILLADKRPSDELSRAVVQKLKAI